MDKLSDDDKATLLEINECLNDIRKKRFGRLTIDVLDGKVHVLEITTKRLSNEWKEQM